MSQSELFVFSRDHPSPKTLSSPEGAHLSPSVNAEVKVRAGGCRSPLLLLKLRIHRTEAANRFSLSNPPTARLLCYEK